MAVCALAELGVRDPFYFAIDQEFPQMQFAEIIKQVKNANILVYGSYDYGFFKSSQTWPMVRHFCDLNLDNDEYKKAQIGYIQKEVVDFIITPQRITDELQGTSYRLISTSKPYSYNGYTRVFHLYRKVNLDSDSSKVSA